MDRTHALNFRTSIARNGHRARLRLLFVFATEHTLLRIFLNIWRQILLPGDMHDAAFLNFCTIECGTPSTLEQLPVYFYLITGRIQLEPKVSKSILFALAVVYEQC